MRKLVSIGLLCISILCILILVCNTNEGFVPLNDVIQPIETLEDAFTELAKAAEKAKKTTITTPTESKKVSEVVATNLKNLTILTQVYHSMIENNYDPVSTIHTIQGYLNRFITIYNYMNITLDLKLITLETNMIQIPTAQASAAKMNQQLALSPKDLNAQLKQKLAKQVPSEIFAQLPALSSMQPPPQLITIVTIPTKDPPPPPIKEPPPRIIDIYDQLKKVYGTSR